MTVLPIATRYCKTCEQDLPLTDFYERSDRRTGYKHRCKSCHRKAMKEYRLENPERVAASKRKTVAKKPEHYKALAKKNYLQRKERDGTTYTEKDWVASIRWLYHITSEDYYRFFSFSKQWVRYMRFAA